MYDNWKTRSPDDDLYHGSAWDFGEDPGDCIKNDIVQQLRDLYSTHPLVMESVTEIERLRELVRAMLENDPDDMAADGVTVLDVWRKEASRALGRGPVCAGKLR